ncbi:uncharacterized protein LOC129609434 [Condylostylus longicornis]|uniref:uncharacterized protein LOC129609434 n=1 Tax=Condylostylus longicornis TaxID=2530218 RepID=UPI00244E37F7|nr:uncharacterized protein LOC129609434 [Condylostylus longicornis]
MDVENTLLLLRNQTESDNLEEINMLRICLSKYHKDIKYQCDICKSIAFVNFGKFMDHYNTEHRVFLYVKDNNWGLLSLYKYNLMHKETGSHNLNKEYYKNRQPKAFVYFSIDFELRFKCNICEDHDFFSFEEVLQHFCSSHSHSFDFENEWVYLILNTKDDKSFKMSILKDTNRKTSAHGERESYHPLASVKHSERMTNPLELFDDSKDFRNNNFSDETTYKPNISIFGSRELQLEKDEGPRIEDESRHRHLATRYEGQSEPYQKILVTKTFSRDEGEEENKFGRTLSLERNPVTFSSFIQGKGFSEKLLEPNIRNPIKTRMEFLNKNSPSREIFPKPYSSNSPNTNSVRNSRHNPFRVGENITVEVESSHSQDCYRTNSNFGRRSEVFSEDSASYSSNIANKDRKNFDRSDVFIGDRDTIFGDQLNFYTMSSSNEKTNFEKGHNRLPESKMAIGLENNSNIAGGNNWHANRRDTFLPKSYEEGSPRGMEKIDRDPLFSKTGTQNTFSKDAPWESNDPLNRSIEKSLQFSKYHYTNPSYNGKLRTFHPHSLTKAEEKFGDQPNETSNKKIGSMDELASRNNFSNGSITSTISGNPFKRAKLENDDINSSSSDKVAKKGYNINAVGDLVENFSDGVNVCNTSKHSEKLFEIANPDEEDLFPEEDDVLTIVNIGYTLFKTFTFECILCTETFRTFIKYMNHLRLSHKTIFLPSEKNIIKLYLYSEDISTIKQDFETKLETRAKVFEKRTRKKAELRQELKTDRSQLPKVIQFKGDWIELAIIDFDTTTEFFNFRCDVCFESGFQHLIQFLAHIFAIHKSCLSYELNGKLKSGNLVAALYNKTKFPLNMRTRKRELEKLRERELIRSKSNLMHSRIAKKKGKPGNSNQTEKDFVV